MQCDTTRQLLASLNAWEVNGDYKNNLSNCSTPAVLRVLRSISVCTSSVSRNIIQRNPNCWITSLIQLNKQNNFISSHKLQYIDSGVFFGMKLLKFLRNTLTTFQKLFGVEPENLQLDGLEASHQIDMYLINRTNVDIVWMLQTLVARSISGDKLTWLPGEPGVLSDAVGLGLAQSWQNFTLVRTPTPM